MDMDTVPPQDEIDRFLATGDHDLLFLNWPGTNILDKAQRGSQTLAEALIAEGRHRAESVTLRTPDALRGTDIVTFTRTKVEPMARGLFPGKEQGAVLALLERSLVFLTPETIEPLIRNEKFLSTAWLAANVYVASIGAEPLDDVESVPVGFSEETTCYVSMAYFDEEDPFADYVVHEAAHLFHNTKRKTLGLHATRHREWLLPIEFTKRETFAYACEFYGRILELGKCPSERKELLAKFKHRPPFSDDRVEFEELLEILDGAVNRRNGWKTILERCSSNDRTR
jgi:hypothetical protein